ncbi:MAG: zinc ribbon domain-containing protein [Chloroherpetonaceae bacterium]|nr:zinc ribbon domain-containing protein [Chthonomonadaceae bacterium]MDW8206779.1 zinc ribbon domain-containing protein [Chloroherpetonaceae bacterium]
MKCQRCSAELPAQSRFCLRCGAPIDNPAINPTGYTAAPVTASTPARNRVLLFVLVFLAIAAAAAGTYVARGLVQKRGDTVSGALVQAPAQQASAPLVQAPAEPIHTPVVRASEPAAPRPVDIEDYLAFLKQIEQEKQILIRKQLKNALVMLAQAKALSATIEEEHYDQAFGNLTQGMSYNANEWEALTRKFVERIPPASCIDLRNKYLDQLSKVQAMILEVNDALNKVQSDPARALDILTQMQGRASAEADEAIFKADQALADVCDRYKIRKDFDIKGDSPSASMFR